MKLDRRYIKKVMRENASRGMKDEEWSNTEK